jgi:hypothetical protein
MSEALAGIEDEPAKIVSGVIVYQETNEQGLQVKYQITGEMNPLAVPALLELATKIARQQLGLS